MLVGAIGLTVIGFIWNLTAFYFIHRVVRIEQPLKSKIRNPNAMYPLATGVVAMILATAMIFMGGVEYMEYLGG